MVRRTPRSRRAVNGIAPGAIIWPEGEADAEERDALYQYSTHSIGEPEEIARAAVFRRIGQLHHGANLGGRRRALGHGDDSAL